MCICVYVCVCYKNQAIFWLHSTVHVHYILLSIQILTSVCWQGNGRYFACSYSNGCVVVWNVKTEHKPEKIMYIHGMLM